MFFKRQKLSQAMPGAFFALVDHVGRPYYIHEKAILESVVLCVSKDDNP